MMWKEQPLIPRRFSGPLLEAHGIPIFLVLVFEHTLEAALLLPKETRKKQSGYHHLFLRKTREGRCAASITYM